MAIADLFVAQPRIIRGESRPDLARRGLAELLGTALLLIAVVGSGIAAQSLSPNDTGLELLALESGYFESLSPASVRSLERQGGPMTPEEALLFGGLAYAAEAAAVRRWDEQAKDPDATTPDFDHFRPLLERVLRSG